jgi:hypothetical protein
VGVGGFVSSGLLFCLLDSHLASTALSFMGSANGGRVGTVSHSQWSSGRTTAPANLIPALLAGPCGGLYFVLRVSLTPLTDYLILTSQRFLLFFSLLRFVSDTLFDILFVLSLHLSYAFSCFALYLLSPSVLLPVLDTGGI